MNPKRRSKSKRRRASGRSCGASRDRGKAANDVGWIRIVSILVVGAYLVVMRNVEPSDALRAQHHVVAVLSLGYGHLFASVWGVRSERTHRPLGQRLAALVSLVVAYAFYTRLVAHASWIPLLLLITGTWHTVENDRAMRASGLDTAGGLRPISTSLRCVALDSTWVIFFTLGAFGLPHFAPALDPSDGIAAVILYHLVSWIVFSLARAARTRRMRPTLERLALLHLPALALCAAALALRRISTPELEGFVFAAVSAVPTLPTTWVLPAAEGSNAVAAAILALASAILSPSTYLFWSFAHTIHTARRRATIGRGL